MRLPRILSTLQEVGNCSYFGLFSIFGLEMVGCSNSCWRPSPRRTVLLLSEDKGLAQEKRCLRLSEGVRLCEGMYD